ncbi:O-antigen ligase family protein [Mycolicibacterium grossiae]|uniref:O-antigen ligase family protein n=1 Tax=Mycolicibacterium grossiae TaxID=1552759 RepID=UPI000F767943|nr:O-antigen ligase family protein [Mycolicibacterium grossiae]QEM45240.1 O-antigen ligase family protein [Mycolicibacterium grossiae]
MGDAAGRPLFLESHRISALRASVVGMPQAVRVRSEWSLIGTTFAVVFGLSATMHGLSPSLPAIVGGSFFFGMLVVRNRAWIVHATLIVLFMTSVPEVPRGVRVGGIFVFFYEIFIFASFLYALSLARAHSADLRTLTKRAVVRCAVVFSVVIFMGLAIAVLRGHPVWDIQYDAKSIAEMMIVTFIAVVLIAVDDWKRYVKTLAWVLSTSALLMVYASATGFVLWGRTETAELYASGGRALAGGSEAVRYLTQTTPLALAVLLGGVGLSLVGRLTTFGWFFVVLPALVISVLSFSRNTLLALAGAVVFTLVVAAVQGEAATLARRLVVLPLIAVPLLVVIMSFSSVLGARDWIDTQISGYANRVVAGLDESNERADVSANYRDLENTYITQAGMEHLAFGGGFGTRYKPASGKRGEFQAVEGTMYAHNAYNWLFVKVGLLGLLSFVVLLLACIVPVATRRRSSTLAIAGAVTLAGLSIAIVVTPMPIEQPGCSILAILIAMCVFRRDVDLGRARTPSFDLTKTS